MPENELENEAADPPGGGGHDGQDAETEVYLLDLYKALSGKGLSDNFREVLDDRVARLKTMAQQDLDSISPADLDDLHLINAASFFESPESRSDVQKKRKAIKRLIASVTKSGRAKNKTENEKRNLQLAWEKVRNQIASSVSTDLETAKADLKSAAPAESVSECGARIAYLELAQKFFAAQEYQIGFDLYEDARALAAVLDYAGSVADRTAQPMPEGSADKGSQNRETVKREADSSELQQPVRDLINMKDALLIEIDRLDTLFLKVFSGDCAEKTTLAKVKSEAVAMDMGVFDPLPDPVEDEDRDRIAERHKLLLQLASKLKEFDTIGTDQAKEIVAVARKKLKELIIFDGDGAQRLGADVTGAGEILLKSKAKDVPQSVVKPIVARLEVLLTMAEVGELSAGQFEMIAELQEEIKGKVDYAVKNKGVYKKCAELIDNIKSKLDTGRFKYFTEAHTLLSDELEKLDDPDMDETALTLLAKLKKLKGKTKEYLEVANNHRDAYKALAKLYKKQKDDVLKAYKKALKSICKLPAKADSDERGLGDKLKVFQKELKSEGHYAGLYDEIWADVEMGDFSTYLPAQTTLTTQTEIWLAEIADLRANVKQLHKDFKGKGSAYETLDGFLLGASENNPTKKALSGAINDIVSAEQEIELRKQYENEFKTKRTALKTFIKKENGRIDDDAREAFENYLPLLSALKSKSKMAKNSTEWKDLVGEIVQYDKTVRAFAKANPKVEDLTSLQDKLDRVAKSLRNCHQDIEQFQTNIRALAVRILGPEKDAAKAAERTGDITAEHVFTLLDQRGDTLTQFLELIAKATGGDKLIASAGDLTRAGDDDVMMAVRENALGQLLRRRRFLEENKSALIYRDNPYELGAEADVLIYSLAKAENDLLTLVKRGERAAE